jgi:hypothetical protein
LPAAIWTAISSSLVLVVPGAATAAPIRHADAPVWVAELITGAELGDGAHLRQQPNLDAEPQNRAEHQI